MAITLSASDHHGVAMSASAHAGVPAFAGTTVKE